MKGIPGWLFEKRKDPSFQFIEEPHGYVLNGANLWSPSSVFRQVGYVNVDYYTDEHRYRGHYVHWIRRLRDENDLDIKDVAPEYLGFLDAYEAFKAAWNFKPRMSEKPIYDKGRHYGVTPDSEGIILEGDPAIVEFKSGEPKSGPPPWWTALQTAAQEMAVRSWDTNYDIPDPEEPSRRRVGVKLFRDGRFKAKEYEDDDDYDTWRANLKTCQRLGAPPRKLALQPLTIG